jgi:hypothetical protein
MWEALMGRVRSGGFGVCGLARSGLFGLWQGFGGVVGELKAALSRVA